MQTHAEPAIVAAAERQMQVWARTAEIEDRAMRSRELQQIAEGIRPYLALSREEGAGGSEIAELIGKELGWDVLDRNLLDRVAERYHLSRPMLELVDETRSNWVHDVLGTWMDRQVVPAEKYVIHLTHVVLSAARRDNVVLVGRGAQFLLPREKGLAVRLIAPRKFRVRQVMQRDGLDEAGACRLIEERDRGRREFVQRFFRRDIDDAHLYDAVLNVERFGLEATARYILAALEQHVLRR